MGIPIAQTGNFRGPIIGYGLFEADSGAVAVSLRCAIEDVWNEGEWADYREYALEAEGSVYIVKKDGSLNEDAVQSLIKSAGWDGMLDAISNQTWQPSSISFNIEEETYKQKLRHRIGFIHPYDSEPRGGKLGNVDETKTKALTSKFGSQLRALVGSVRNNQAPPAGGKPSPPKKPAPAAAKREPAGAVTGNGDSIPF